jgi:hypothetical protein
VGWTRPAVPTRCCAWRAVTSGMKGRRPAVPRCITALPQAHLPCAG